MLDVEENTCPHGKWSWQPCEKCIATRCAIHAEAKVLLREIYDKGYLNVNEPLRQRVLSCLFPPIADTQGKL
jgi:hypothetical protein